MKDPAFLFYSSDFLTGVSDLTFEERGQYITLLCLQHQKGRLSAKAVAIAVPNATADVLAKFRQDDGGNYFNPRLEVESEKRAAHSEKQRQRALTGWKKRKSESQTNATEEATANATALPLEDVIENEDENVIKNKGGVGESKKVPAFQKPPTEYKIHPHSEELCQFFKVHPQAQHIHFKEINNWVLQQEKEGNLKWIKDQLSGYAEVKKLTGQSKCNWRTWIEGKYNESNYSELAQDAKSQESKTISDRPTIKLKANNYGGN
jgi:hypothetical protein